jgi:hypothetical protein
MMPKLLAVALLVASPCPMAFAGPEKEARAAAPVPKPELTPEDVIVIQLEALRKNDLPTPDAGIATTFRFASPSNRKVTGPLARFAMIVKSPGYKPMIGHRIAGYGPVKTRGDLAVCRVTVVAADGQAYEYEFRLSKDPESKCWFTDGVILIPDKPPIDEGKVA